MFRILTCLTTEHDWRLVVVAGVICLLASLVAVNLYHRARATAGNVRLLWIITAGAATGSGIWATHFIAMLAYDPGVGIAFHTALTVLSLLAAAIVTSIGLGIAAMFPGRLSDASDALSWPIREQFFSMKSATCRLSCNRNCCECSRSRSSKDWAVPGR